MTRFNEGGWYELADWGSKLFQSGLMILGVIMLCIFIASLGRKS